VRIRRLVWRHVPAGAEPLHLGWMQRARGRWNTQRPRVTCLYTAYTANGALGEFVRLAAERPAYAATPRDLVSIHVDVEPVADFMDADVRREFGLDEAVSSARATRPASARFTTPSAMATARSALLPPPPPARST